MKILAIALALGDLYDEAGMGIPILPPDGAVARFDAVTAGLEPNKNVLVVCTAGYSKKHPLVPQPERQNSLAGQMSRFIFTDKDRAVWSPRFKWKALCWSTRNEVRVGIKFAQRLRFASTDEKVVVRIASNKTHLCRIRMYADLYTPKNWIYELIEAEHYFSSGSEILELAKKMRDKVYIRKVKMRLERLQTWRAHHAPL